MWDSMLANITGAVKSKGMWDNTLLIFSSDNGGPTYWSETPGFNHGAGANNWPLRGSKADAFEGGIRVAAFVSGGIIPTHVRGTRLEAVTHLADWCVCLLHCDRMMSPVLIAFFYASDVFLVAIIHSRGIDHFSGSGIVLSYLKSSTVYDISCRPPSIIQ